MRIFFWFATAVAACLISPAQAKKAILQFDVPAPCSQEWAARDGLPKGGANKFGVACLARYAPNRPRLTKAKVFALALAAIRENAELIYMSPRDIEDFCPKYIYMNGAARYDFWAALITAIARPESSFNPMNAFWEGDHDPEYSIGLLQISPSNRQYYNCGFQSEAQLTDPDTNLACGVRIMSKLVQHQGDVGGGTPETGRKGGAAYWSTLRAVDFKPAGATGGLRADTRSKIARETQETAGCR